MFNSSRKFKKIQKNSSRKFFDLNSSKRANEKMAILFISDRILIDGGFHHGGIVVNNNGKIDEVFKDPMSVNKWLNTNKYVQVRME